MNEEWKKVIPDYANISDVALEAFETIFNPPPAIMLNDWPSFNLVTGGFRMNEFTIICGGTGVGKTTFLANVSTELLKQEVEHVVLSVETGRIDYMRRIISNMADMDLNTGEKFNVDNKEIQNRIFKMLPIINKNVIRFSKHENRLSSSTLLEELKFMYEVHGSKFAILDNLNFFMEVTTSQNAIIEMDRVIHDVIMFCKEHAMHIFMVMHPKKTDHGQVLSEFDIKGSSTAVQESQNIFLLNRPTDKQIQDSNGNLVVTDRLFKIAKMRRRGKYVGKTIVFSSNGVKYSEKGYL